ncbi:MAG: c-type cytochrome [Rhodothermales bacterium]
MTLSVSDALRKLTPFVSLPVLGGLLVLSMGLRTPDEPEPLRACFLSGDMPLSLESPDDYSERPGLYVDLAQAMAEDMGRPLETHFAVTAFYKRPVREGLLAKRCDVYFGLPVGEEGAKWFIPGKVALSEPFTEIGYAIVAPRSASIQTLEDLSGMTVGVQGGSPPVIALSRVKGVTTRTYRDPEPALEDLSKGAIDAAFVWGPRAGYYAKYRYSDQFQVIPTELSWPVALGVRAEDAAELEAYNQEIRQMQGRIKELRSFYGLPEGEPIPTPGVIKSASSEDGPEAERGQGEGSTGASVPDEEPPRGPAPSPVSAATPDTVSDGDSEKGQRYFNAVYGCAHCHGTDAEGATAGFDLRLLRERHGDESEAVFMDAVKNGRQGTAMPPWEGVISEERINDIKAFIFSLQKEPGT